MQVGLSAHFCFCEITLFLTFSTISYVSNVFHTSYLEARNYDIAKKIAIFLKLKVSNLLIFLDKQELAIKKV